MKNTTLEIPKPMEPLIEEHEGENVPNRINGVLSSPTQVIATLKLSHTSWKMIHRLAKTFDTTPSDAIEMLLKQLNLSEPLYCKAILSQNEYANKNNKHVVRSVITAITDAYIQKAEDRRAYKAQFKQEQVQV
jgi:hypothetical protein